METSNTHDSMHIIPQVFLGIERYNLYTDEQVPKNDTDIFGFGMPES